MPVKPGIHKPFTVQVQQHPVPTNWGQGRGGRKWRTLREQVFQRDKFLCQMHLRRGELRPVSLHGKDHGVCDHIIPLARGGRDALDNLQTICQQCNQWKTAQESNGRAPGGWK